MRGNGFLIAAAVAFVALMMLDLNDVETLALTTVTVAGVGGFVVSAWKERGSQAAS